VTAERFPVEEGHVLAFARAIGDPNPLYTDRDVALASAVGGLIAPPTFVQASAQFDPDYPLRPKDGAPWFGSGSAPSGGGRPGSSARPSAASVLHAEQRFEYHRLVRVGDVLSATTRPGRTWEKQGRRGGTLRFSESVTEYRNEDGELVVTATAVGVRTERVPDSGAD
jgi:acyl dehydratase